MEIRPTQIDELPELADFLSGNGITTAPDVLRWKLWESPEAIASRPTSFVACAGGRIVGHIGIIHTSVCIPGLPAGPISGGWFIDWMVAREMRNRGVGILLLRELSRSCRCLMTIQGSADTRTLLSQLNWTRNESLAVYKLNLRAGAVVSGGLGRRMAAELARALRYHPVAHPAPEGWRLEVPAGEQGWDLLDQVLAGQSEKPGGPFAHCRRSGGFLRWRLRNCPCGRYRLVLALRHERPIGYAIWRILHSDDGRCEARIVDVGLPLDCPQAWRWLISTLTMKLADEGVVQACCLAGAESPLGHALVANRYLRRQVLPIWTCPEASEFTRDTQWHLTFADSDIDTATNVPASVTEECAI